MLDACLVGMLLCYQAGLLTLSFEDAIAQGTPEAVHNLVSEVCPGVYTFEIFSEKLCEMIIEELHAYEASGLPKRRPNSMNNYGLVVNDIGMEYFINRLQLHYIQPIARVLFETAGACLDHHHAFMVQYMEGQDVSLDMHHDDAEVTLNVCLGKNFQGAALQFCGIYGESDHRRWRAAYLHRKGYAVMHLGRHRHGADQILSGERYNLVVWSKGRDFRKSCRSESEHNSAEGEHEVDTVCLSYTHDPDFEQQKSMRANHGQC